MIKLKRKHLGVMMEAGYIFLGMNRYREAKELFEGLCVIAPESELPHVALGNVEFCSGKADKAVRHYAAALKKEPKSVFAKVYMGEALFFTGKKTEAIKLLAEAAKADKGGAGDFALALLDAISRGFEPKGKTKRVKP